MLEQYLGAERFREGVSHYLRTPLATRTPRRTISGMRSRPRRGEPVRRIMDSWIWQPGYPLVTAAPRRRRPLQLRQERFRFDDDGDRRRRRSRRVDDQRWAIPVHVRNGDDHLDAAARRRVRIAAARLEQRRPDRRQRRRARLLSCRLQRRAAQRDWVPMQSPRCRRSSATTSSTMPGLRPWPGGCRPPSCSVSSRVSRASESTRCGRRSPSRSAVSAGCSTPAPPVRRSVRRSATSRHRRSRRSANQQPTKPTSPASCADSSSG